MDFRQACSEVGNPVSRVATLNEAVLRSHQSKKSYWAEDTSQVNKDTWLCFTNAHIVTLYSLTFPSTITPRLQSYAIKENPVDVANLINSYINVEVGRLEMQLNDTKIISFPITLALDTLTCILPKLLMVGYGSYLRYRYIPLSQFPFPIQKTNRCLFKNTTTPCDFAGNYALLNHWSPSQSPSQDEFSKMELLSPTFHIFEDGLSTFKDLALFF